MWFVILYLVIGFLFSVISIIGEQQGGSKMTTKERMIGSLLWPAVVVILIKGVNK